MSQDRQIQELQEENRHFKQELGSQTAAKEFYWKALQKLLPVENFEYDQAELEDLLANPNKYQTLGQLLDEFEKGLAQHGK